MKAITRRRKKRSHIPRALALVVISAIICAVCMGMVFEAAGCSVIITQRDKDGTAVSTLKVTTDKKTVGAVLDENKIAVGDMDDVNFRLDERVSDKQEIIITKKTPVMICADGEKVAVATAKSKVKEILAESGIEYSEDDEITPSEYENVGKDMLITVVRVEYKEEKRIEYTEPEDEYTEDVSVESGTSMVIKGGQRGETEVTERVKYEDGKPTERRELSRRVIKKPEKRVIATAPKDKDDDAEQNEQSTEKQEPSGNMIDGHKYTKKLEMVATAYSAFRPDGSWGTTAMGVRSEHGIAAVDRNVIPLGTKLYVEGYGEALAADTGGAIKGNRIDLCFEDTEQNLSVFGRKTLTVYILEE